MLLCEIIGYTVLRTNLDFSLFCRVISRGIFGLLLLYNAIYLIFTSKWSFLWISATSKQRLICGVLLGLVGLVEVVTAFLGYGTNGDPRLIWWKQNQ